MILQPTPTARDFIDFLSQFDPDQDVCLRAEVLERDPDADDPYYCGSAVNVVGAERPKVSQLIGELERLAPQETIRFEARIEASSRLNGDDRTPVTRQVVFVSADDSRVSQSNIQSGHPSGHVFARSQRVNILLREPDLTISGDIVLTLPQTPMRRGGH